MESVLGFTLMATRVNILYDRGISEARRKSASAGACTQPSAISTIRHGQKILTRLWRRSANDRNVLSRRRRENPKPRAGKGRAKTISGSNAAAQI